MARFGMCAYDFSTGDLMMPQIGRHEEALLRELEGQPSQQPTLDVGYYHGHTIEVHGQTQAAAQQAVLPRINQYFDRMQAVTGYASLSVEVRHIFANGRHTCRFQNIYVVEDLTRPGH